MVRNLIGIISLLFVMILSGVVRAADDVSEFAAPSSEYLDGDFTNEMIKTKIFKDMQAVCNNGLCTIFAKNRQGSEFIVKFEAAANPLSSQDPNVVSYGANVGLTIQFTYSNCTTEVLVPTSVYYVINTYLYKMLKADGDPVENVTPSAQAMLLFYTTIMQQAGSC